MKEDGVGKEVRDKNRVQGKDMGGQRGKTNRVAMAIGAAAPTEVNSTHLLENQNIYDVFIHFSFRSVYGAAQIQPKTQMILHTYTVSIDWAQPDFIFRRFQLVGPASKYFHQQH